MTEMSETEKIAAVIVAGIRAAMAPRDGKIAALEAASAAILQKSHEQDRRIMELEAHPPSPEYHGTFEQGRKYPRGALVTKNGGLWLSLGGENTQTPGANPTAWRLVVKSGDHAR